MSKSKYHPNVGVNEGAAIQMFFFSDYELNCGPMMGYSTHCHLTKSLLPMTIRMTTATMAGTVTWSWKTVIMMFQCRKSLVGSRVGKIGEPIDYTGAPFADENDIGAYMVPPKRRRMGNCIPTRLPF
jgi:hypothetical protein